MPTKVVRLPVDVVEALGRKAARKDQSVGEYLREALGLPMPPENDSHDLA